MYTCCDVIKSLNACKFYLFLFRFDYKLFYLFEIDNINEIGT